MPDSPAPLLLPLTRLAELLERLDHPRATEVRAQLTLLQASPHEIPRQLDSNAWWAGAGSLAAETMADNPGLPEVVWRMEIREFRALLIEIGEQLLARGVANPRISSWIQAFGHWNQSEV
ncbi:MAG: hypothetical protein EOM91_15850 [Sphingobacteriia bacterium]|nr:hypothetical protein [Sphingobacteriia bacterium]NCC41108.1 hypothetical protein [Gammaproteobacteria bacterium]